MRELTVTKLVAQFDFYLLSLSKQSIQNNKLQDLLSELSNFEAETVEVNEGETPSKGNKKFPNYPFTIDQHKKEGTSPMRSSMQSIFIPEFHNSLRPDRFEIYNI